MSEATLSVGFRNDMVVLIIEAPDIFEGKEPLILGYSVETIDLLIGSLRQAQLEVKKFTGLDVAVDKDVQTSTIVGDSDDSQI